MFSQYNEGTDQLVFHLSNDCFVQLRPADGRSQPHQGGSDGVGSARDENETNWLTKGQTAKKNLDLVLSSSRRVLLFLEFFGPGHFLPSILNPQIAGGGSRSPRKLPWKFELWKMPRRTENAASAKPAEPVKEEECLQFDDHEEVDEEEVEYEEIEEEVEEYEEVEEEEEEEEDLEETEVVHEFDTRHGSKMADVDQKDGINDEDEKKKRAELLALPPHGSEVYIGGISSDASSEDLKKLCESVGEVVEVRMRGGDGKLYAFVNFRTKGLALKAIQKLNNRDLKGKKIRVSSSQAKNKLFIGNVPRSWTQDEFQKAVEEIGPGVLKVDLLMVPRSDRNKGFGFIEYYNQACAEYARQKMSTPEFKLDTNAPTVSWADSKNGESASTAQVKSLYVKNLPKTVTQEQLKKLFEHLGEITKVVLPPAKSGHENRYGFVHFKERSTAMKALQNTERYELDGQLLDCSLAKPPADKKDDTVSVSTTKGGPLLPSYTPLGYGLAGAYNPLGNGLAGAYGVLPAHAAQPLLYAPGAPSGSTMVPMVLPDGRLVYVQQLAGQQPLPVASPPPQLGGRRYSGGGGSVSGGSSSGGKRPRGDYRGSNNNSRRGRHHPY